MIINIVEFLKNPNLKNSNFRPKPGGGILVCVTFFTFFTTDTDFTENQLEIVPDPIIKDKFYCNKTYFQVSDNNNPLLPFHFLPGYKPKDRPGTAAKRKLFSNIRIEPEQSMTHLYHF